MGLHNKFLSCSFFFLFSKIPLHQDCTVDVETVTRKVFTIRKRSASFSIMHKKYPSRKVKWIFTYIPEPTGRKIPVFRRIMLDRALLIQRSAFQGLARFPCLQSCAGTRQQWDPLRHPIDHFLNDRKSGYELRPQSFLGSFGGTEQR